MRTLLIPFLLAFAAGPLFAQDDEKPIKPPDREQILAWVQKLGSADEAERKEAQEKLREIGPHALLAALQPGLGKTMGGVFFPGKDVTGIRVMIDPRGAGEIIDGSWSDGESKVTYTLKSLGKGRYKLTGTKTEGKAAEAATFSDEGTMADLKKRHDFLKANVAVRVPGFALTPTGAGFPRGLTVRRALPAKHLKQLGVTVRRPEEALAYHLYLPRGVGFVVESVDKGSLAERIGLEKYDVLTRLGAKWIEKHAQLANLDTKGGVLEYVRRAKPAQTKLAR